MTEYTWDTNIQIDVFLRPAGFQRRGFSRVGYITPDAGFGAGDRTLLVTARDDLQALVDSGDIDAALQTKLQTGFAQNAGVGRQPQDVLLINQDVSGGGESIGDAYSAVKAERTDFYGIAVDNRVDSELATFMATVEAENLRLLGIQSSNSNALANDGLSGDADFGSVNDVERTLFAYHDEDTEVLDLAVMMGRLAADPDFNSAPWYHAVDGVAAYTSPLSSEAEKTDAEDQGVNLILPFGAEETWFNPGAVLSTRPAYIRLTADWFETRLQERVTRAIRNASAEFQKIPVSRAGQNLFVGLIRSQFRQGVGAGHFLTQQLDINKPAITTNDLDEEQLTVEATATLLIGARKVNFTINLQRTPVFPGLVAEG